MPPDIIPVCLQDGIRHAALVNLADVGDFLPFQQFQPFQQVSPAISKVTAAPIGVFDAVSYRQAPPLKIDHLRPDNFLSPVTDAVHSLHPAEPVQTLQIFRDIFGSLHLSDNDFKPGLGLFVQISEIRP